MRKANNRYPLVVEPYPEDYDGYEFLTLIHYNDESFVNIVDNIGKKHISCYVLDLCGPSYMNEEGIIEIARDWFYDENINYPISIEFSKRGIAEEMSDILRRFSIDYV